VLLLQLHVLRAVCTAFASDHHAHPLRGLASLQVVHLCLRFLQDLAIAVQGPLRVVFFDSHVPFVPGGGPEAKIDSYRLTRELVRRALASLPKDGRCVC
jgi:hypothetical protein